MNYIKRILEQKIVSYLGRFPVVGITGPRQAGKSTLLKHLLSNTYQYLSFDNSANRDLFYQDPILFMETYSDKVIFDEAQKVPELFEYIKEAVDNDRDNYGKYIITGSAQFSFIEKISESLAGRIGLLSLLPLQFSELPKKHQQDAIIKGSYPEPIKLNYADNYDWYSAYIETYLERDIKYIANIGNLRDFRNFIKLLAANTSQILNMSNYAKDIGVSVPTIKRWISILEASYIVFLLPPYFKNYGKRIIKNPKLYFYDTGLVSHLTGITTQELFLNGPMKGSIFENYIIAEVIKKEKHLKSDADFYYYRTSNGDEIDLIVDRKISKELIEIKYNSTFTPKMLKQINSIIAENDRGYLLYTGKSMSYGKNFEILNYRDYL